MRPIRQTLSAAGFGSPIVMDFRARNTNTAVHVKPNGSTVAVQGTYDDPFAKTFNPATADWFTIPQDSDGTAILLANPCAIRGNVTTYTAPALLTVITNAAPMG